MRVIEMFYSVKAVDFLLLGILIICCYTDLKERKVFNIIVFPAALVALLLHLLLEGGAGVLFWGKGTLAGLALLLIPFMMGGIGAGDVKLLGVVGSFKGAAFVLQAFLCAAILGGIFSFFFLLKKKRLKKTLANLGLALKVFLISCFRVFNLAKLEQEDIVAIPYGLAIGLGTIVCLVGDWLC